VTTTTPSPVVVAGAEGLAVFRQTLGGPAILARLAATPGGLLLQLPVGVGKTTALVDIISSALASGAHDLVVMLCPRWDVARELLQQLPPTPAPVVLEPRPRKRCGDLDEPWVQYERQGLGALGRQRLCGACPRAATCPWPSQFGIGLRGARLVVTVQHHLVLNPAFVLHVKQQAQAHNPLVLVDESYLLVRPAERTIPADELYGFIDAQEDYLAGKGARTASESEWLELSRLVAVAPTADLRGGIWRFPWVHTDWAVGVQERGLELAGPDFRFLGYELHHFATSDAGGRERLPGGDIRFTALPHLGDKFVVTSGSMAKELARYRLDPNFARPELPSPFAHFQFRHPDTRWFNINSLAGAARFFIKNAGAILDFFGALIARNILNGKRTLLVSRKQFIPLCRRLLRERLTALDLGPFHVVTGNWRKHDLHDPRVISLINYGMLGVNAFEHMECAYALNSYYVSPAVVSRAVQDVEASTERYPLRIVMGGDPRRRRAVVDLPDGRVPILPWVADQALEQLEADVVLQAVGRVRPFTKPRQVITFQADDLPGVQYAVEFHNLDQARKCFNVQTSAQASLASRVALARRLKAQGLSRTEVAQAMGISLSSVRRYLRREGGHGPLINIYKGL
jgi:hypothetical protein